MKRVTRYFDEGLGSWGKDHMGLDLAELPGATVLDFGRGLREFVDIAFEKFGGKAP